MSENALPKLTDAEQTALVTQLGAVLLSAETILTTVELVTQLASETIPGTTGAGVTLIDERGKRSTAASSSRVEQADALQYELDAGPCLTAWRDRTPVRVDDSLSDTRWPQWGTAVAELGVRSLLSVPLVTNGTAIGAIKVYADEAQVYDARAEHLLELFARQAAILLANTLTLSDARQASIHLTAALQTRDIIGQAKGVLLAQGAGDSDAAFAMLLSASQRSNLKIHEVARQLIVSVTSRNAGQPGS